MRTNPGFSLATARTKPHRTELFLAIHKPRLVWMGVFDKPPCANDWPASQLNASGTASGNLVDIASGMSLWIGPSTLPKRYGRLRIRGGTGASSAIRIAEMPCGLVQMPTASGRGQFSNPIFLSVFDEREIWPIHQKWNNSTSGFEVDFDPYTSQTAGCYGPVALMGPPAVVWLDGAQTQVCYVGDRSYTFSPSTSINANTWRFPDGTTDSVLGSSQTPRIFTVKNASPNGSYCSLFVKDSNNASHQTFRLVFAFNSSNASPFRVAGLEQINGGLRQGGYQTRVRVYDDATSNNFPDGTQVVLFEKASYGSSAEGQSLGGNYPFRQNVVMVGWLQDETIEFDSVTSSVSFNIRTVDSLLRDSRSFDIFLESNSAVAASPWIRASGLNLDKAALVLTKYRSTISNVVDVNFPRTFSGAIVEEDGNSAEPISSNTSALDVAFQALPAGTLWDQIDQNYNSKGWLGLVSSDMQSSLYFTDDILVTGGSDNADYFKLSYILTEDIQGGMQWEHSHRETCAQYKIFGFTTNNVRVGSVSPAEPGGYFGRVFEVPRGLVVESQAVMNVWAGNLRAKENNPYKRIVLNMAGNYRMDSVPQFSIRVSVPSGSVPREIQMDDSTVFPVTDPGRYRLIPYETNVRYDAVQGVIETQLVCEALVNGIGGSTVDFIP